LGHWWGNLKWVVLSPGHALRSLIVREGGGGTKDGLKASYAGRTHGDAETGGEGGRRGKGLPEGRKKGSQL